MAAFDKLSRKDRITMVAEVGKKTGLRAICCNFNGIIVNNVDRTCRFTILGNLRGFLTKLKRCLNVLRCHLHAIVELNTLSQVEKPFGVA